LSSRGVLMAEDVEDAETESIEREAR
jgi:hypothetical protein